MTGSRSSTNPGPNKSDFRFFISVIRGICCKIIALTEYIKILHIYLRHIFCFYGILNAIETFLIWPEENTNISYDCKNMRFMFENMIYTS